MHVIQYPINGHTVIIHTNDNSKENLESIANHIKNLEGELDITLSRYEHETKSLPTKTKSKTKSKIQDISYGYTYSKNYTKTRMNETENHSFNDKYN